MDFLRSIPPLLLAALAGALLGIGALVAALWWCSFFGMALVLWVMLHTKGWRAACGRALLAGAVAYTLSSAPFFATVLPLDWLGITSPVFAGVLVAAAWSGTVAAFSLLFALCMVLVWCVNSVVRGALLFLAPVAMVVNELFGPLLFSVVHAGPGSLIGIDAAAPSLSYQLAESSVLLQSAWLGGVFALAALLGLGGAIIYMTLAARTRSVRAAFRIIFGVVIVIIVFGSALVPTAQDTGGGGLRIALINTYNPATFSPDRATLARRISEIADLGAQTTAPLVVLPEDSRFLELAALPPPTASESSIPRTIVDSATVREGLTLYSRVAYYNARVGDTQHTYKAFLVPFGEYLPSVYKALLGALGQDAFVRELSSVRGFRVKDKQYPVAVDGIPIGALLCDEIISPTLYAAQASAGAQVFVNLASHAWFHDSRVVHLASERFAKVRASESRRYFVRAANAAPSFAVDPYGRVVAEGEWGVSSVLEVTVAPRTERTPYVRLLAFIHRAFD